MRTLKKNYTGTTRILNGKAYINHEGQYLEVVNPYAVVGEMYVTYEVFLNGLRTADEKYCSKITGKFMFVTEPDESEVQEAMMHSTMHRGEEWQKGFIAGARYMSNRLLNNRINKRTIK